jgi:hypothetical protein
MLRALIVFFPCPVAAGRLSCECTVKRPSSYQRVHKVSDQELPRWVTIKQYCGVLPAGSEDDPEDDRPRQLKARRVGVWADNDNRYMATRPAREGFYAKFEREVDPEGKLTPQERAKRVEWAMKAHMQRMALKSAKARRRKR